MTRLSLMARFALLSSAGLLALGCSYGSPASIDLDVVEAAPLVLVQASEWRELPASCEGLVAEQDMVMGVAESAVDLLVVIDAQQQTPLCVDTFPALESELDGMDMDRLWFGYMATLQQIGMDLEHPGTYEP